MSVVTIRLSAALVVQLQHEAHIGMEAVRRLRSAGVPVLGAIWPRGVDHGRLVFRRDDDGNDFVIEWHFNPADVESVL